WAKLNKNFTAHSAECQVNKSYHYYTTVSFRKVSTMGIKGLLAADIGQLTELQSLYVAA
uniref:Uncharacterized protein n=1 Tax=Aegilops tauschii subsp. strangulata TaxID=200361 RepID=A0A453I6B1_AEGTS